MEMKKIKEQKILLVATQIIGESQQIIFKADKPCAQIKQGKKRLNSPCTKSNSIFLK